MLELDDIQSGVLRPRPSPYVATYIAFRIDDPIAGRELMRRISLVVTPASNPTSPARRHMGQRRSDVSGFQSAQGASGGARHFLMGVSSGNGVACRRSRRRRREQSRELGDAARVEGRPCDPLSRFHLTKSISSKRWIRAREAYREMTGIEAIWRQNCHALPDDTEPFGFKDGISHPAIEGSGIPGTNPQETAAQSRRVRARLSG